MIKVVINTCYGGFGLSKEAEELYESRTGEFFSDYDTPRHDPTLVKLVEELGPSAAGASFSDLTIVEVEGDRYYIKEYDGYESVVTPADIERMWVVVA